MNMTFEQIYNQMAWTRQPEKVEAKGGVIAAGNGRITISVMTMRLSCR